MKNHQWKNVGCLQWGNLGLPSSSAESYEQCELCGAKVGIRYNDGEGLSDAMVRAGVDLDCPKGVEQPTGGKKIFCFCNGGSPGWYDAIAMCEDGVVVGQHVCSTPGWCQSDLGIGSTRKHDQYKAHCPDGYELVWVDDPKNHEGLDRAYALNQELAAKAKAATA